MLAQVVRMDFNQSYSVALGKRVQCEHNSNSICTEEMGRFKERRKSGRGDCRGLRRVREVNNDRAGKRASPM